MNCGTPAGVNLTLTLTSAMLFTGDVTVAIESDGGSKSIDVQRAVVVVLSLSDIGEDDRQQQPTFTRLPPQSRSDFSLLLAPSGRLVAL